MKKSIQFLSLLFLTSMFLACKDDSGTEVIETEPIVFTKEGELQLLKASGDTIQELDIEIADDNYERQTGLMYRESMEENQGMLFIYSDEDIRNFYMKNTHIPLDIIFFSSDSIAVSFQENAEPEDLTPLPGGPAQYVLEINAGLVEEWNLQLGDKFSFQKIGQ